MSQPVFENHGKAARVYSDPTQLSGRYFYQKADERNIIADIFKKRAWLAFFLCYFYLLSKGN